MSLFLFKRFVTLIATLIGASVIVFLVLEILPGNAAQMLMGPDASPDAVAALATKLGLDQPAWTRYWHWIGGLLTGDLGDSYAYSSPVLDLILERLALTVPLALLAMAFTTVLALIVGVTAAARHNKLGDVGLMGLTQVGIAIPNFWFAILLILRVLGAAAMVLGRRLRGLGRRRARRAQGAAAAGPVAGGGAGRDPGAHHALGGARGDARGLRAHRARQGRVAARGAVDATCCATR